MTEFVKIPNAENTEGILNGTTFDLINVEAPDEEVNEIDWQAFIAGTCAVVILSAASYVVYKKYKAHVARLSDAYHETGESLQKRKRSYFLDSVRKEADKIRVADSSKVENEERPS